MFSWKAIGISILSLSIESATGLISKSLPLSGRISPNYSGERKLGWSIATPSRVSESSFRIPSFIRSTDIEGDEKNPDEKDSDVESMSFDTAGKILSDEADLERQEKMGNTVTKEDQEKFAVEKVSYDEMRSKIRSRASELKIDKSVTTKQAIEEANARAAIGEKPGLDLSRFGAEEPGNPDDELSEEEMIELDKTAQLNLFEQAKVEFGATQWPTPGQSIKQAGLMLVIFVISASFILKLDDVLRSSFTEFGLIPRADEVFDYSNLELPDKWTDMMNEEDLTMME